MNWKKLCPNLSFTTENKMGNLHKAAYTSNLIWWIIYYISSNFKNLSMNWENIFHWGKTEFWTHWKFAHTTEFFNPKKDLANTLTLLSLNVNNAIILTQTDNRKYRKMD